MRKLAFCVVLLAGGAVLVTLRPAAPLQAQQRAVRQRPAAWDPAATRVAIRYGI